uniref:Uncharacterized protein n=1 Tax=Ixodes ricinus TaxID=34613 RepID=A0A0K8RBI9_IXORI
MQHDLSTYAVLTLHSSSTMCEKAFRKKQRHHGLVCRFVDKIKMDATSQKHPGHKMKRLESLNFEETNFCIVPNGRVNVPEVDRPPTCRCGTTWWCPCWPGTCGSGSGEAPAAAPPGCRAAGT